MNMWNGNDILEAAGGQSALILEWLSRAALIIGITAIIVSLLICFFGLKLLRVLSALTGLSVGAGIGTAAALGLKFSGSMVPVMILVCAVVMAVLCGGIRRLGAFFVVLMQAAGVLVSVFGPWALASVFTSQDLVSVFTSQDLASVSALRDMIPLIIPRLLIMLGVCAAVSLFAAVLAVIRTDPVTVVVTGISGGLSAGGAASLLLGTGSNVLVGYGIGAVLALLGIWTQFVMQSRKIGRREEVYSRQMREQVSMESEVEKARKILEDEGDDDDDGAGAGKRGGLRDAGGEDDDDEDDDDITIISEDL